MKRVLVVGASSFIGLNTVRFLRDQYRVMGTYARHKPPVDGMLSFQTWLDDLTRVEHLVDFLRPEAIVYCAGMIEEACDSNPEKAQWINGEIPLFLARKLKKGRLIYLSSSKVFSGDEGDYLEDHQTDPRTIYGLTKRRAEERLVAAGNVFILRLVTVFGLGGVHHQKTLFHRILQHLWSHTPLPVICDEYRSYVSVEDVAKAIGILVDANLTRNGIYHFSPGIKDSHFSFAKQVALALGISSDSIRGISGKEFDSLHPEKKSQRGKDLTLLGTKFTGTFGLQYDPMENALAKLRDKLTKGLQ